MTDDTESQDSFEITAAGKLDKTTRKRISHSLKRFNETGKTRLERGDTWPPRRRRRRKATSPAPTQLAKPQDATTHGAAPKAAKQSAAHQGSHPAATSKSPGAVKPQHAAPGGFGAAKPQPAAAGAKAQAQPPKQQATGRPPIPDRLPKSSAAASIQKRLAHIKSGARQFRVFGKLRDVPKEAIKHLGMLKDAAVASVVRKWRPTLDALAKKGDRDSVVSAHNRMTQEMRQAMAKSPKVSSEALKNAAMLALIFTGPAGIFLAEKGASDESKATDSDNENEGNKKPAGKKPAGAFDSAAREQQQAAQKAANP